MILTVFLKDKYREMTGAQKKTLQKQNVVFKILVG
jgi:hypothetical protein